MRGQRSRTEANTLSREEVVIIITPQGEIVSPWWSPTLEDLLRELGVKDTYPGEVFWGEEHLCG